ncbi:hypothetical protein ACFVJ5_21755 [Nocardia sp. NPDC127606]|uniref:hypothetical protein n=1 Tax=Nocardia sp. NPDC127606 TaxID=3345406 RepID=UPI00363A861C
MRTLRVLGVVAAAAGLIFAGGGLASAADATSTGSAESIFPALNSGSAKPSGTSPEAVGPPEGTPPSYTVPGLAGH